MRKEKELITLLRNLVKLLVDEASRNSEFATRLEQVLAPLPKRSTRNKTRKSKTAPDDLPDIHDKWQSLGHTEFQLWLQDQPVEVLRALIRKHDLDAARRTVKWNDSEKLSSYIADQLQLRFNRGSSFLRGND